MLNFTASAEQDFVDFARSLWLSRDSFSSHEQASQYIAEQLFREFCLEDGQPQLSLVRIFRLTDVDDLPPEVQQLVDEREQRVMALTGTWGIEEAWQHRTRSKGHQAVPISAIAVPERIPMFQEVLTQLGVDIEHLYETHELIVCDDRPYQGTFYVPNAHSPVIPAQDDFVIPYGIKSLVGFGGFIATQEVMYLLYAFANVPVSGEAARRFYRLQEFVGATIAIETTIFDS